MFEETHHPKWFFVRDMNEHLCKCRVCLFARVPRIYNTPAVQPQTQPVAPVVTPWIDHTSSAGSPYGF